MRLSRRTVLMPAAQHMSSVSWLPWLLDLHIQLMWLTCLSPEVLCQCAALSIRSMAALKDQLKPLVPLESI